MCDLLINLTPKQAVLPRNCRLSGWGESEKTNEPHLRISENNSQKLLRFTHLAFRQVSRVAWGLLSFWNQSSQSTLLFQKQTMKHIKLRVFTALAISVANVATISPVAEAVQFKFTNVQVRTDEVIEIENSIEDFRATFTQRNWCRAWPTKSRYWMSPERDWWSPECG